MSNDDFFRKAVNSSGFPLQIRIEHLVKSNPKHGWTVLTAEHAWSRPDGNQGFLDLVLEKSLYKTLITIECKRVRETSWIFLQEKHSPPERSHFKAFITYGANLCREFHSWAETQIAPTSPESKFCVVVGQDPKSKPMLERIAAELIQATTAFSDRDADYHFGPEQFARIVIPVIVTTAELRVCELNVENISLSNGEIEELDFRIVPFVRFRKQFEDRSLRDSTSGSVNYRSIDKEKENSVFVVNSNCILEFLEQIGVQDLEMPDT